MTSGTNLAFIIIFYWTTLHKPWANQKLFLEMIQQPWVGGKADNLGLSLNTQISFTFIAVLYGSTADICEPEWKTTSLEDYHTATLSLHFREFQWSSEAATQNEVRVRDRVKHFNQIVYAEFFEFGVLLALLSIKITNRFLDMTLGIVKLWNLPTLGILKLHHEVDIWVSEWNLSVTIGQIVKKCSANIQVILLWSSDPVHKRPISFSYTVFTTNWQLLAW